jgi:hypothetical protein
MASTAGAQTLTSTTLARPAGGPGSSDGLRDAERAERRRQVATAPSHPWCATGEQTTERQEQLAHWIEAKKAADRTLAALGKRAAQATTTRDHDLFIMNADSTVAPFGRPFDLNNSSIYFTRTGANSFSVQKTALQYDSTMSLWTTFNSGVFASSTYTTAWSFPFGSASHTTLYVSSNKGLFFSAPPTSISEQYDAIEALEQRVPVIAPLLHTSSKTIFGRYEVYIHDVPGSYVSFTWKNGRLESNANEDIQATLFANGDIRFSYRAVPNGYWGAVMVTTGSEPFYDASKVLGSGSDPVGDVPSSIPAPFNAMVDVQNVSVKRISNSNLMEFQVTMAGDIDRSAIAPNGYITLYLDSGGNDAERSANGIFVKIHPTFTSVWFAGRYARDADATGITAISGNTITVRVMSDRLAIASPAVIVNALTAYYPYDEQHYIDADAATLSFSMTSAHIDALSDLSTWVSPISIDSRPIVEPFTLPSLSTDAVWNQIKSQYGYTDADIDAVSIYQNFYTDLIFYAGGYANGGNSGAAGIRPGYDGTVYAKTPNLMHLDRIGRGWNWSQEGILGLRSHEFAHRWLYYITIMENGVPTYSLNPDHAHPKQGEHMPAAVNWVTANDASTMGGGYFTQTGASTYTAACNPNYGYTWHELYLMGLATSSEVIDSWYYLSGSGLDGPYFPYDCNSTYTPAARTNVTQQQIVDAMGSRNPSNATSQKTFKELVVVLQYPSDPIPTESLATLQSMYVDAWHTHFNAVTLERGTVISPPLPPCYTLAKGVSPEAGGSVNVNTGQTCSAGFAPGTAISLTGSAASGYTFTNWSGSSGSFSSTSASSTTFTIDGNASVTATFALTPGSTPANLVATSLGNSQVNISWVAVAGTSGYELTRSAGGQPPVTIASPTSTPYVDGNVATGTTYVYRVRAISSSGQPSPYSNPDIATTMVFTDEPLVAGSTVIKAAHLTELRTAVNAVRATAGLTAVTFAEPVSAGVVIKAAHIEELRTALSTARSTIGVAPVAYTNSLVARSTLVRAADVTEIRGGVK